MSALILKAQLALGTDSDAGLVDVSDQVTALKISAQVDQVDVPPTGTTPAHARGGAADYSVTINYLSNDVDTLFSALWDAITGNDAGAGILFFEGSMRDEAISATNPLWAGSFVVTEASVGGAAEALSTGSATFPMTGAPSKSTTGEIGPDA